MKHRWYTAKFDPRTKTCSTCQINVFAHEVENHPECLAAKHSDPAINKLYRARRKAAEASDGSGWKAIDGWRSMESIEAELGRIDPTGDWRYEGNLYDGQGWRVRRPREEYTEAEKASLLRSIETDN